MLDRVIHYSKMVTHFLWSLGSRIIPRSFFGLLHSRNLHVSSAVSSGSTVDHQEVEKFDTSANEWWSDKTAWSSLLRSMNTLRVPFVRDGILSINGITAKTSFPLKGYSVLDVGCGGGLLSEPLARLGASVTGLDPGSENIKVASEHASQDPDLKDRLNYVCDTVENHVLSENKYDAVVCSEVIEHVNDVGTFVRSCADLTKDGGSLFFTTINRTPVSYVVSILGAEYITGLVPRGTHEWNKFITPEELSELLQSLNCHVISVQGSMYNPVTGKWSWCSSLLNLYALHAVK
ncbi:ubiquinone biosynthesis O-methyltransferase, mitochondrial-like isoform X1 [Stegodyphus dumicola]|uniref:ubiquinone biosynthesis O-methyltransferase, mitochondrial-like isoform X1 n=1 Tax=Stegodyphus dumicola TaxID=202533 RepID=UPI0015B24FAD|nr:ubiquinone biosynthesis O-methyltransferase, mitochondrial-like isoform X1 [Stegodyphus dumicola]